MHLNYNCILLFTLGLTSVKSQIDFNFDVPINNFNQNKVDYGSQQELFKLLSSIDLFSFQKIISFALETSSNTTNGITPMCIFHLNETLNQFGTQLWSIQSKFKFKNFRNSVKWL